MLTKISKTIIIIIVVVVFEVKVRIAVRADEMVGWTGVEADWRRIGYERGCFRCCSNQR